MLKKVFGDTSKLVVGDGSKARQKAIPLGAFRSKLGQAKLIADAGQSHEGLTILERANLHLQDAPQVWDTHRRSFLN